MAAVIAGPDPTELLVAAGMLLASLASIRPAVHAYVAWFNRHTMPPAAADARALRGGRAPLPAGLSPEPAGPPLAAHPETSGGQRAAQACPPDPACAAPGEQQ